MFKLALNAGHYKGTAGKRCDKIESKLKAYDGYQLLRIDDTTGATDIAVANRAKKANAFGADFYLSIHHNAGIYGGTGGGVVAYTYTKVDDNTKAWQKALYDAIIKHTGLKGNRATPLASANLGECRKTTMACVLLECGFMDSKTDVPIILTDDFAEKVATACVEVIVARGKLTKKVVEEKPSATDVSAKIYRVQVGAYSVKSNAEALQKKLKADGYDSVIVEGVKL